MWDEAFARNLYKQLGEIRLSGFTTMEQLSQQQAAQQCFRPFPPGTRWGKKWEYGWFHASVTLPEDAAGKRILLHLGAGPEMLVYVNGVEAGSIDKQHNLVELTACAAGDAIQSNTHGGGTAGKISDGHRGESFEIYAECYAGHGPRRECGGIFEREDVPVPEPGDYQCVVESSHFGIWDQEMFAAYADYHTLYELWKVLPEGSCEP